ncbi:LmeA family phospholipid-binding protein [Rhodococcus sp. NPDC058505]|uniref:LmeA family phospholipid-binding protein n=1 Tax=unclassified Rhodococcus (in: high G+C Gram-positive bacteria) TaxID=192944 RepID=UPI00364F975E
MRKLILTVACLLALVVVVDFGAAAYSEYRVSRSLRAGAGLNSDPDVTITGFPFLAQVADGRYRHVEVRARGVPSAELGDVSIEADLHGVQIPASDLLGGSVGTVPVERLDGRVKIEATSLGAYLGIPDLEVSAPPADRSDGTGGSGGSGMSTGGGIVLTGTVPVGPVRATVSVTADLVLDGENVTIVATDLYFGPEGQADFTVPAPLKPAVLGLFTRQIDVEKLPFGVRPTKVYAEGSQVAIEGSGDNVVINLDEMVTQ